MTRTITDEDLATCTAEFFAHPEVIEQMKEDDFDDGLVAHLEGKAMTDAWALLQGKAGTKLTAQMVHVLPVQRGLGTVTAEDLAAMPEQVLNSLVFRRGEHATFLELANLIRKQPDRFPPEVVRALQRDDEDYFRVPDAEERAEHRLKHALDRPAATIEAVLRVQRELVKLHERLDEVYEAATRKRGIFGL